MPFAPHVRVTALGELGADTPLEKFSYGFNMAKSNSGAPTWLGNEVNDAYYQDIADSVRDFHARATSLINPVAILQYVKIAPIGADGTYTGDPRIFDYTTPGGGAASAFILPQSALAVSLNTERRGPSGRGRFFVPMPTVSVSAADNFVITTAAAESLRDSADTMISDVNDAPGLDSADSLEVVVASTKGYNTLVTSVRVGRVVDTIRSRRNKLLEMYTANANV